MTTKSLVDEDRYTVQEVAEMFDVSTDNVYQKIHAGQLRAFTFGRKLFVTKASLDAYLLGNEKQVTP